MKVLPFSIESMDAGEDVHFQIIIDGQDRSHLLRIDINEINGELTPEIITSFPSDWVGIQFDDNVMTVLVKDWVKKNLTTLRTTMTNNIGQVRLDSAQEEIDRLNAMFPTRTWRKDFSRFMVVSDQTDDRTDNPCERSAGYVWITCEPENF